MKKRELIVDLLRLEGRLLTFRLTRAEFHAFDNYILALGLFYTWVVGIGRWWNDPDANLAQHLGIESLVYAFTLSFVIWIVVLPLKPEHWSYKHVLTCICLTSIPAILYAIPVEWFTEIPVARSINVSFVAITTVWRLAFLLFYLKRSAGLSIFAGFVVALLSMMVIVGTLAILDLERTFFDIMGGRRDSGAANDDAFGVLFGLTVHPIYLVIPVFICYLSLIFFRRSR